MKSDPFHHSEKDWMQFLWHTQRIGVLAFGIISAVILYVILIQSIHPGYALLGVVIYLPLFVLANYYLSKSFVKKLQAALGDSEVTYEFTDSGVSYISNDGQSDFQWSDFQRLIVLTDLHALFIKPRVAILVPRHAFSDEAIYQESLNLAQEKIHGKSGS